jgi:hypothetical protein
MQKHFLVVPFFLVICLIEGGFQIKGIHNRAFQFRADKDGIPISNGPTRIYEYNQDLYTELFEESDNRRENSADTNVATG